MKRSIALSVGLVLLAGALAAVPLPRPVFLGTRSVEFRLDHDEILVGRVRGAFRRLEFRVSGNDLELYDMAVIYGDGRRDDLPTQLVFREGEWTRQIDLAGVRRSIRKIVFNYRSLGPRREGKAVISVYGIR